MSKTIHIHLHDATLSRIPVDQVASQGSTSREVVNRYLEILKAGGRLQPIEVVEKKDGRGYALLDGHHRVQATALAGMSHILAKVMSYREYLVSANR